MRLLNINTLELKEFHDDDIPAYIILSHRWQGQEISHKDFVKGRARDTPGHRKVVEFCDFVRSIKDFAHFRVAAARHESNGETESVRWTGNEYLVADSNDSSRDLIKASRAGIQWAWIDTCCIDKTSSAELSEAINSMFKWYARAVACVVYMSDVTSASVDVDDENSDFCDSSWFFRGWTLQELLSPSLLIFCNKDWARLGYIDSIGEHFLYASDQRNWRTRTDGGFTPDLSKAVTHRTGINGVYFNCRAHSRPDIRDASIADRMSWAAQRETLRAEDIAYCLLGIFDVHMPLLYGEGDRAFLRLQQEIIRHSNDMSIFAWSWDYIVSESTSLFARDPSDFNRSAGVEEYRHNFPFAMTNHGLEIRAQAIRFKKDVWLNAVRRSARSEVTRAVRTAWGQEDNVYVIPLSRQGAARCRVLALRELEQEMDLRTSSARSFKRLCAAPLPDGVIWNRELAPEETFYIQLFPR